MDLADLKDPEGYKPKPSFMDMRYLNELKLIYEKEGNPVFAWIAYDYARQLINRNYDLAIPDWVFEYLDNAAKGLLKIGPGKGAFGRIAAALGMWTQGRGTALT